jgi:LCP family protein required for cell wall assembly
VTERHDRGSRRDGSARAGGGSAADPGRELDEMLSRWARERDGLYQQDSSWLDELRTGEPRRSGTSAGPRSPDQGRHAGPDPGDGRWPEPDGRWPEPPSGLGPVGPDDGLAANHPSYPGPPPAGLAGPDPSGRYGYGHSPHGHPADSPVPAEPRHAVLTRPVLPGPYWAVEPAGADPGLLTHGDGPLDVPSVAPLRSAYPVHPPAGPVGADPYEPAEPFYPGEPSYLPPAGPRRGRHRRGGRRWLKVVGWVGAMLGVLVVAVAGWGFYEYRKLSANVHRIDVLAPDDPSIRDVGKQRDAENFLLIGSDTRAGANGKYEAAAGQVSGQRSDTTILAHLSPNRDKAILISLPRDSWVDIPACRKRDGSTSRPGMGMFNSAFETGGPKCTVLTVQKLTGISVNHYVQVDFTGFKTMVDALGGVTICSRQEVYDKESGLRLRQGSQVLRGEQALAYVRARKHIGDWSDLGRIQRQQRFLGAMIRKATSSRLLFNPIALTRFLGAATKSLTLDRLTSFGDLKKLADQLRNLDPKRVTFLTAPIANADYSPPGYAGGGRVLLDGVAGRRLWDSIINDKPAPPKGAPKPPAGQKTTLSVAPGDVSVRVLNGVGIQGLARRTAADLTSVGFAVTDTGNSPSPTSVTLVRYAPGRLDTARTLAAAVPGSVLQEDASLGRTVVLVAGQDPVKVVAVGVGDPVPAMPSSRPPAPTTATKPPPSTTAADASCG